MAASSLSYFVQTLASLCAFAGTNMVTSSLKTDQSNHRLAISLSFVKN